MIGIILRKVREDANATILRTWEDKVLPEEDIEGNRECIVNGASITIKPYGGKNPRWYDYSNGSRVYVGGMDRSNTVLGGEPSIILVSQAEELTAENIETLMTRVTGRGGQMKSHPAQLIMECNPGGQKHPLKLMEAANTLTMINAKHRDNPSLYNQVTGDITEQGNISLGILNRLSGVRRARLLLGQWVGAEGLFFSEFDHDTHGIADVPDLSTMSEVWGSMDYGFNHWNVFQLHCKNGDGIRFTIHEVCHRQHYPSEIAPDIASALALYGLEPRSIIVYSGPDTFAKTGRAVEGIDDQYRKFGFRFRQWDAAPGSRTTKAHEMLRLLGSVERKQPPLWFYVRQNCKRLEQTLPIMVGDPSNPESVKKIDCDESGNGGDDSYDCLVGGITRVKRGGMA